MKSVRDFNLKGKKVLVRCDFNVPLNQKGDILDDFRIEAALPTIQYLIGQEAKAILMSHLDDPGGKFVERLRLTKVRDRLSECLDFPIAKTDDCLGPEVESRTERMRPKEVLLLENLRFHSEEEAGDLKFAEKLSKFGEIFLNDAFGTSHRDHASFKVARYLPCGSGLLLEKEIEVLAKIRENADRPLVVILGGKPKGIESKIRFLDSISAKADFILLGNLVDDELKKMGFKLGEPKKLISPVDSSEGFDIGPKTIELFKEKISLAKTVFWSGPLGKIEEDKFSVGSREVAKVIVESGAFSVAGGGETTWFLRKTNLSKKFSHLSTGGDALLIFLSGEKLPAVEVLK
ncbi:MAG: phosphoglycerate kinase [bacterium]|nr:phosphoglycerate kinase [bacterium]